MSFYPTAYAFGRLGPQHSIKAFRTKRFQHNVGSTCALSVLQAQNAPRDILFKILFKKHTIIFA